MAATHVNRFLKLISCHIARTQVSYLACLYEGIECVECFLNWGSPVPFVNLIDVNVIRSQAAQATLDSGHNVLASQTDIVWTGASAEAHLCCNHKIITVFPLQPATQNLFGFPIRIYIGSINEVTVRFHKTIQDLEAVFFGGLASEGHCAQAKLAN